MATKLGLDLKTARLNLRVSRSAVTKAISEFEKSGAELDKNVDGSKAKKLRLAVTHLENLEKLVAKIKKMEIANEATIEVLLLEEGQLSKPKDELVDDYEKEHEKYMKDATDIQGQMEDLVMKAEELMAGISNQPVSNTAGGATAVSGETAAASADSDILDHIKI